MASAMGMSEIQMLDVTNSATDGREVEMKRSGKPKRLSEKAGRRYLIDCFVPTSCRAMRIYGGGQDVRGK